MSFRERTYRVIFEAETPAGQAFDVALLFAIGGSILVIVLQSVVSIEARYGTLLTRLEWGFTVLFTLEYGVRLAVSPRPVRYARSFFGIVDLFSILPTYIGLLVSGPEALAVVRGVRLLRVFRVLKLGRFLGEGEVLAEALAASRFKITVFIGSVLSGVLIFGTAMYLIEGPENGFASIPEGMYWAIVTLTTVGYGDVVPSTVLGKVVASAIMMMGYGVLAVPTGIMSAEIAFASRARTARRRCVSCRLERHDPDARFCRRCAAELPS